VEPEVPALVPCQQERENASAVQLPVVGPVH
jgi:hypothetical protein